MRSAIRIIEKIVVLFITGAAIAFLFASLLGAFNRNEGSPSAQTTTEGKIRRWASWDGESEVPRAYVVVYLDDIIRSQYLEGMGEVHGLARNASSDNFSYIQISVGIYVNDTKVGSCYANQTHLAARTSWEFSGTCTGLPSSAFQYRVEDVTYW